MRPGARAMRNSLFAILENRADEISLRMSDLIVGLYEDWLWLDERIETVSREIEEISQNEANCRRLMSVPGVGPMISTAMVAAIGSSAVSQNEGVAICEPCLFRRLTLS